MWSESQTTSSSIWSWFAVSKIVGCMCVCLCVCVCVCVRLSLCASLPSATQHSRYLPYFLVGLDFFVWWHINLRGVFNAKAILVEGQHCYYLTLIRSGRGIMTLGLAVRVFANGPGDLGSIPGRVIQKTQKMVLDASLLNTQHYKVRIKGKVEQSREGVALSPTPWCSSYRKGSLRVTLDYGRQLYFTYMLPKGISTKVNVIAGLEFELAYYDVIVQNVSHYSPRTPPSIVFPWHNELYKGSFWDCLGTLLSSRVSGYWSPPTVSHTPDQELDSVKHEMIF